MIQTLDELVHHIRKTVPQSKTITRMTSDQKAGAVMFDWQSRKFAVKKSLQVFEMKGPKLYKTGASTLLQANLEARAENQMVIANIVEKLQQAEKLVESDSNQGLSLLQSVKQTMEKILRRNTVANGVPRLRKSQHLN